MSKTNQNQDFTPPPQYSQTKVASSNWIVVTTTKVEANGDRVQSLSIISKRG
jgi:hypothetical protein